MQKETRPKSRSGILVRAAVEFVFGGRAKTVLGAHDDLQSLASEEAEKDLAARAADAIEAQLGGEWLEFDSGDIESVTEQLRECLARLDLQELRLNALRDPDTAVELSLFAVRSRAAVVAGLASTSAQHLFERMVDVLRPLLLQEALTDPLFVPEALQVLAEQMGQRRGQVVGNVIEYATTLSARPLGIKRDALIQEGFSALSQAAVVSLEGLPGAGKSHLLRSLAHSIPRQSSCRGIVGCNVRPGMTLAQLLDSIEPSAPYAVWIAPEARLDSLMANFEARGLVLAVDNAHLLPAPDLSLLIESAVREGKCGRALLASDVALMYPGIKPINVGGFDHDEVRGFLRYRGLRIDEESVCMLKERTQGLPVALTLFCTAVDRGIFTVEEALGVRGSLLAVTHAWFEAILQQLSTKEADLLAIVALAGWGVPDDRLRTLKDDWSVLEFESALYQLLIQYLISRVSQHRSETHTLIAAHVCGRLSTADKRSMQLSLALANKGELATRSDIWRASPIQLANGIRAVRYFLAANARPDAEATFELLIPRMKREGRYADLLELGDGLIEATLEGPASPWTLFHVASAHAQCGSRRRAEALLLQLTDESDRVLQISAGRVLGRLLIDQDRYVEAEEILSRVIRRGEGEQSTRKVAVHRVWARLTLLSALVGSRQSRRAYGLQSSLLNEIDKSTEHISWAILSVSRGRLALEDDFDIAEKYLREAWTHFSLMKDRMGLAWTSIWQTRLALQTGGAVEAYARRCLALNLMVGTRSNDYRRLLDNLEPQLSAASVLLPSIAREKRRLIRASSVA